MNLQVFIKTALAEIVAGVAEARIEGEKHGASIGSNRVYGQVREAKIITDNSGKPVSNIEFDIALAEANGTDTKGGIGVFLGQSASARKVRRMVNLPQTRASSSRFQLSFPDTRVNPW